VIISPGTPLIVGNASSGILTDVVTLAVSVTGSMISGEKV
jgi:hypothetical protein